VIYYWELFIKILQAILIIVATYQACNERPADAAVVLLFVLILRSKP